MSAPPLTTEASLYKSPRSYRGRNGTARLGAASRVEAAFGACKILYDTRVTTVFPGAAHSCKDLRSGIYTGRFDWDGKTYQGRYEPIISADLWEQVQDVLDGRTGHKSRTRKRDFAFSGLIGCDACGCAIVGEIKKERYIYCHCTGYADKCSGTPQYVAAGTGARRRWSNSSPPCWASSTSMTKSSNGCETLSTQAMLRSAASTRRQSGG
jgi:hypothetical protein